MIRIIKIILSVVLPLAALLAAENIQTAGYDHLAIGAEALARGGAYLAAKDSGQPVFQNYAFLNSQTPARLSFSSFQLLGEVNYLTAALGLGNFSLGLLNISESSGYLRDERNNLLGGEIGYSDMTYYAAYGLSSEQLGAGMRLKYYSKIYSGVDASASGLALDLAGFYKPLAWLVLGANLNNLGSTGLQWSSGAQEEFPMTYGLGAGFKLLGVEGLARASFIYGLDLYTDIVQEDGGSLAHFGLELWPNQYVALRLGLVQNYTLDSSAQEIIGSKYTAGVNFNWHNLHLDYAYAPGNDAAENVTHFLNLSYRFPGLPGQQKNIKPEAVKPAAAPQNTAKPNIQPPVPENSVPAPVSSKSSAAAAEPDNIFDQFDW